MEAGPTLLHECVHIESWFMYSLIGWGMDSLVLSVGTIAFFVTAIITSTSTKAMTWTLLAWSVVALNIIVRADHDLHSIGGEGTFRLLGAASVLYLMVDALILPGLTTTVLLVKWKRHLATVAGRWQAGVLIGVVFTLTMSAYMLVRLSHWLTHSTVLAGVR